MRGSPMARGTVERLAPLLALLIHLHPAAAQPNPGAGRAATPPRRTVPDPALLEYLGFFETADGRWIDPMSLATSPADPGPPADAGSGSDRTHDSAGGSER